MKRYRTSQQVLWVLVASFMCVSSATAEKTLRSVSAVEASKFPEFRVNVESEIPLAEDTFSLYHDTEVGGNRLDATITDWSRVSGSPIDICIVWVNDQFIRSSNDDVKACSHVDDMLASVRNMCGMRVSVWAAIKGED